MKRPIALALLLSALASGYGFGQPGRPDDYSGLPTSELAARFLSSEQASRIVSHRMDVTRWGLMSPDRLTLFTAPERVSPTVCRLQAHVVHLQVQGLPVGGTGKVLLEAQRVAPPEARIGGGPECSDRTTGSGYAAPPSERESEARDVLALVADAKSRIARPGQREFDFLCETNRPADCGDQVVAGLLSVRFEHLSDIEVLEYLSGPLAGEFTWYLRFGLQEVRIERPERGRVRIGYRYLPPPPPF